MWNTLIDTCWDAGCSSSVEGLKNNVLTYNLFFKPSMSFKRGHSKYKVILGEEKKNMLKKG